MTRDKLSTRHDALFGWLITWRLTYKDAAQIEQTYVIMYNILASFLCQVFNFNLSEDCNSSAPH